MNWCIAFGVKLQHHAQVLPSAQLTHRKMNSTAFGKLQETRKLTKITFELIFMIFCDKKIKIIIAKARKIRLLKKYPKLFKSQSL